MTELVPVRATEAARIKRAAEVVQTAPQVVEGRIVPPTGAGGLMWVVTVVVADYGGHPRDVAAAQVWADWQARYPGALIQVVHADAGWEPVL